MYMYVLAHVVTAILNWNKFFTKVLAIQAQREESDSRARGPGFDTRSSHILSFLLPLIQEGQLSVTGKSMCMKYWLTTYEV